MPRRTRATAESNDLPEGTTAPSTVSDVTATPDADATNESTDSSEMTRAIRAQSLPVLIIPQTVLLPRMSLPFPIDDSEEAQAIDYAMKRSRLVLVVAMGDQQPPDDDDDRHDSDSDDPQGALLDDDGELRTYGTTIPTKRLARVGVIAEVGQRIQRPGGQAHVILQGQGRGVVQRYTRRSPFTLARIERHVDPTELTAEGRALMSLVQEQVESYIAMLPNASEDVVTMVRSVDEPGWLADLIAFSPEFESHQRQELLETLDPLARLRRVSQLMQDRLDYLSLRQQIQNEAQSGIDRQQREYLLREQMRTIQRELGEMSGEEALVEEFREKIEAAQMPEDVEVKALVQVQRLEHQHPFSPEIGVIRSYLEWLTELPWAVETPDQLDLKDAARILDEDHYGLDKVKERIIEFIAVRKLAGSSMKAPIICFVGPPGVGKTSLGKSIARALGRSYQRVSLGGVRDEAEIRGHRRTYVGAMPGRVIKAMRDAGTRNPVLVLDEIDKVGADAFRGDPSSALLEVLDPEQNHSFSDHYLEVPFDLSQVIFITTANLLDPIPPALRDRMEIIDVTGYTENEKLEIGRQFLLPKALEAHGLRAEHVEFTEDALLRLIREYTYESGVRNLNREIGAVCRKVARRVAELADDAPIDLLTVTAETLPDLLGIPRYDYGLAEEHDEVGVATGAAVTQVGGDLLAIEVSVTPGTKEMTLTGQLGDVMQESARAALSYARSRAAQLGIASGFFDSHTFHIHVPAGAIPKDGPSAGVTMATALISAATGKHVRKDVAMTGEITLRGKVLPIGGVREKALAAHRGGITTFIVPRRNEKDLTDLPESVRSALDLRLVSHMDDVLAIAMVPTIAAQSDPEPGTPLRERVATTTPTTTVPTPVPAPAVPHNDTAHHCRENERHALVTQTGAWRSSPPANGSHASLP